MRIATIARDFHSRRDRSLVDLWTERDYSRLRPELTVERVAAALRRDPGLIDHWQRLSLDKRTTGGWALGRGADGEWIVGMPFPEAGAVPERRYDDAATACADFILSELDFGVDGQARAAAAREKRREWKRRLNRERSDGRRAR